MAQATRRRGAGGQTAWREGWQAHRRTGRDRAAHPRTRSRKQPVAHHRGRPGHHGKSTRSLGVTVRESGLRRAAQEALTETFAMLTGHGVSTRQAATLTGLVRSTATRRRNAATALTPAVCTEPAVEPANKLTDAERRRVVEVLTSDRFVDLAPLQIYAQLLDEGVYLCSVSTMYRVFGTAHAGRRTPPAGAAPQPGVPGAGRDRTAAGVQLGHHQTRGPSEGHLFRCVRDDRHLLPLPRRCSRPCPRIRCSGKRTDGADLQGAWRTAGRARRSGNLDDQQDRRHAAR